MQGIVSPVIKISHSHELSKFLHRFPFHTLCVTPIATWKFLNLTAPERWDLRPL